MRTKTLSVGLLVLSCALAQVTCITNQEFFDLIKDYAEDLESVDLDDPVAIGDGIDDSDSDVIDLPGKGDDELDVPYLLMKLDLADTLQDMEKSLGKEEATSTDLGWWRRRRRRRRRRWHNPCTCHRYYCRCCLHKTFRVNVIFKRWKFRVNACVMVRYLRRNFGFLFTVTFNGRRVYRREISLRRPPSLCYGVPGLARFVRACVQIYNVNLRRKSLCVRLAVIINVRIKKFRFRLKLACFRIPMLDELENQDGNVTKLLENMEASVENEDTGEFEELSLSELPSLYRQLEVEMAEKYNRQMNEIETESTDNLDLNFEPEV